MSCESHFLVSEHSILELRVTLRIYNEQLFHERALDMRIIDGYNHLISNKREWNNCVIKNNQELLLDLADFALQEQPEENLMVGISRAWYNLMFHIPWPLSQSNPWNCIQIQ